MSMEQVTFGGSGLDRADRLRGDAQALAALRAAPACRILALWQGRPLVTEGAQGLALCGLPADHPLWQGAATQEVFLGLDEEGAGLFARSLTDWQPATAPQGDGRFDQEQIPHPAAGGGYFIDLRAVMTRLSARDAELAATARALFAWHETHGFCAKCGAKSEMDRAGWQRVCPACGGHHFPRTDPVVIMLVTRGNRALLGRSPGWPEGMYSCLAGFVEPGETIEAAVRREVMEEAGVPVGEVSYVTSQPWPFPASLMMGCRAEALADEITIDPAEIEDARWVTREELAAVAAGDSDAMRPARPGAIAHFLLQLWLTDRIAE